jgi:hypothetical protein
MTSRLIPILLVTLVVPAYAGGRRRVAAASPSQRDEVTIAFVGVTGAGSEAMVDAGTMSQAQTRNGRSANVRTVTRKAFGIRIDAPGRTGTAMLRAFLETYDGRCIVRIDGIELGATSVLIDAQTPFGEVTTHTLEIEVPTSVPAGAFASSVRWEVTAP